MDIREKEKMHRKRNTEREYGRSLMNLHNYEAGRRVNLKNKKDILCNNNDHIKKEEVKLNFNF